jgi:hypothetical protein
MPINHASKQGISKWTTSNTVHGNRNHNPRKRKTSPSHIKTVHITDKHDPCLNKSPLTEAQTWPKPKWNPNLIVSYQPSWTNRRRLHDEIVMAVEVLVDSPQPISLLEDEPVNLNGPVPKTKASGAILDPPRCCHSRWDAFD